MEKIRLQFSPTKRIENALTIWFAPGADVDVILDLRHSKLGWRQGSVDAIYDFGLLSYFPATQHGEVMREWVECLKPNGEIYLIEPNFEYIARAIQGGDLKIEEFNEQFVTPSYLTPDSMIKLFITNGFQPKDLVIWESPPGIQKRHYEHVLSGHKPKPIGL